MKKHGILLKLALGILLLLAAACQSNATEPDLTPELTESVEQTNTPRPIRTPFPTEEILRGTISIRHSWDETKLPALATIIKLFQSYHPDVMFDVLYIPADTLRDRFSGDTAEGLGPTILLGPAEWGAGLFQDGLIADLANQFDPSLLNSLNPAALSAAYAGSTLTGLPYAINGVTLYRNTDVITIRADTFDELVSLAQTSTQGATIGAFLERSFFYSGGHLPGLGGQWIDENNLPGFNNGKGIAWLELLKAMEQAGPPNYFSDADIDRFKLGEVGWIIDGTWNLRELSEALGPDKLAVDPWPTYRDGRMSGFVVAENVYLNAKVSETNRRSALEFIRFLLMSESQSLLANAGFIPAAKTFRASDPAYGALITQAAAALAGGVPYPTQTEFAIYSLQLDQALRGHFEGGLSAEQALQTAQDGIMAELAKTAQP